MRRNRDRQRPANLAEERNPNLAGLQPAPRAYGRRGLPSKIASSTTNRVLIKINDKTIFQYPGLALS